MSQLFVPADTIAIENGVLVERLHLDDVPRPAGLLTGELEPDHRVRLSERLAQLRYFRPQFLRYANIHRFPPLSQWPTASRRSREQRIAYLAESRYPTRRPVE